MLVTVYEYEQNPSRGVGGVVHTRFRVVSTFILFGGEGINRFDMCIQWSHVIYSVVITQQSNPPISQFSRPCDKFTSVWSMFVYNNYSYM